MWPFNCDSANWSNGQSRFAQSGADRLEIPIVSNICKGKKCQGVDSPRDE